jgi:transcription-repair coupling factor (superfamily II helicase)
VDAVLEELIDRYGPLPSAAERLVAVARLRLLLRQYGITEVSSVSESTLRLSPLQLVDSQQLRLKRLYPGAHYRATTSTVQVPIPRAGSGVGSPRIRDLELVAMVAGLVLALDGKPQEGVDITKFGGAAMTDKRQAT